MRVAFLTGSRSYRRGWLLSLKYRLMRMNRLIYPDVFCLPRLIANRVDFIRDGGQLRAGRHALVFSELNGSIQQLTDLRQLIRQSAVPVIVIPGPPEILADALASDSNGVKRQLVGEIATNADAMWAYNQEIRDYCSDELGARRVDLIPWVFDARATLDICRGMRPRRDGRLRLVFAVPIRFAGPARNGGSVDILRAVWARLPVEIQTKISIHSFAYTDGDAIRLRRIAETAGLPIIVERRRTYRSFVRFIGSSDAVVNLTAGAILGRVTFIAAATGRPGLWTDNASLNRALYPHAVVSLNDPAAVTASLDALIRGLAANCVDQRLRPCVAAVNRVGDPQAAASQLRALAAELSARHRAEPATAARRPRTHDSDRSWR